MKTKLLLIFIFMLSITVNAVAGSGDIHFGNTPDIVLEPSHAGYNSFINAVNLHTDGNLNVNWSGVQTEISTISSLSHVATWLGAQTTYAVYIICCLSYEYGSCLVEIPYSCEYWCPNCPEEDPIEPPY